MINGLKFKRSSIEIQSLKFGLKAEVKLICSTRTPEHVSFKQSRIARRLQSSEINRIVLTVLIKRR